MAIVIGFGEDVQLVRYERFKFAPEESNVYKRIVFISQKVLKDSVHYFELPIEGMSNSKGYKKCLSSTGHCPACSAGIVPADRYATHILEYYTNSRGEVSKPFGYSVKAFVMGNGQKGQGTFRTLSNIKMTIGDSFFSQDILVNCTNPKYQTMAFLPTGTCALLELGKANPEAFAEVKADYNKKIGEMDLKRIVAPEISEEAMQVLVDNWKKVTSGKGSVVVVPGAPSVTAPTQTSFAVTATTVAPTATTVSVVSADKVAEAEKLMKSLSL
jgi:hypothetical protein